MKYQWICVLALLTLVSACATKVSSLRQDVDLELAVDDGYLLMGVDSNSGLESVNLYGADNVALSSQDLRPGTNFVLIPLRAGQYHVEKINLNKYWYIDLAHGYWDFSVIPGSISYIGHLEVESYANFWMLNMAKEVVLANRSTEALLFMQRQFPTILNNRKLFYAGPGNDPFLEKMHAPKREADDE